MVLKQAREGAEAASFEVWNADGMVLVDMGQPVFEPSKIPVSLEPADGWCELDIGGRTYKLGAASMGNPHAPAAG